MLLRMLGITRVLIITNNADSNFLQFARCTTPITINCQHTRYFEYSRQPAGATCTHDYSLPNSI